MVTSPTEDAPIFSKARVSNIMAAVVIGATVYGFIAGIPQTVAEGSFMGVLVGFAAKHLFDSRQT